MEKRTIVIELSEDNLFGVNIGQMSLLEAVGMLEYAKKTLFEGNRVDEEEVEEDVNPEKDEE